MESLPLEIVDEILSHLVHIRDLVHFFSTSKLIRYLYLTPAHKTKIEYEKEQVLIFNSLVATVHKEVKTRLKNFNDDYYYATLRLSPYVHNYLFVGSHIVVTYDLVKYWLELYLALYSLGNKVDKTLREFFQYDEGIREIGWPSFQHVLSRVQYPEKIPRTTLIHILVIEQYFRHVKDSGLSPSRVFQLETFERLFRW